jgi:ABC-2 type transport system ATP-binding protein
VSEAVLLAEHLSHAFGALRAVDDVSLSVAPGEIYGLVGPDGAGKTTALRLIVGAFGRPAPAKNHAVSSDSRVTIQGFSMERQPEQARAQLGYLSQRFSLYEDLTVLENVRFLAETRGVEAAEWQPRAAEMLRFVGLNGFETRLAGRLSGGMKQKLALACALIHHPRLLLLDEPTTGVDPVTRQDFWQLVFRLAGEQNLGVLVCTPYMDEATRCSRVGFLRSGRLIAEDAPRRLRERLHGRIMELAGAPAALLLSAARADPAVQDAQRFGDRLHLRVAAGQAEAVKSRLMQTIPAAGGRVERLETIPPLLDDVFIELAGTEALAQANPLLTPDAAAQGGK